MRHSLLKPGGRVWDARTSSMSYLIRKPSENCVQHGPLRLETDLHPAIRHVDFRGSEDFIYGIGFTRRLSQRPREWRAIWSNLGGISISPTYPQEYCAD